MIPSLWGSGGGELEVVVDRAIDGLDVMVDWVWEGRSPNVY